MKTYATYKNKSAATPMLPYPCAATRKELFSRLLDKLLVGAIGAGAAASLLFIIALF